MLNLQRKMVLAKESFDTLNIFISQRAKIANETFCSALAWNHYTCRDYKLATSTERYAPDSNSNDKCPKVNKVSFIMFAFVAL